MDQESPDPDFVAAARKVAADLMPILTQMAGELHDREWAIHPATFAMLISAALHHQTTEAMAKAARKPKTIEVMFTGIKAYGMMFDYVVSFDAAAIGIERSTETMN